MTDQPTPPPTQQRNLFEFFDEEARGMMGHARDEVVRTKRVTLEAEHLLGALLVGNTAGIKAVLDGANIDVAALREALDGVAGIGDADALPEQLTVGAGAQNALQVALQAAGQMLHGLVRPEHVLLGLIQSAESPAALALAKVGSSRDALGRALMNRLQSLPLDEQAKRRAAEAQRAQQTAQAQAQARPGGGSMAGFTESAQRIVTDARRLAGELRHGQVGSVHLLLALLNDNDRMTSNVFFKVGVRPEDLRKELMRQLRVEAQAEVEAESSAATKA